MPVYLETVTQLDTSTQDYADLEKLYDEYLHGIEDTKTSDSVQWLEQQLNKADHTLYVGRFNGRLLGAVVIKKSIQNSPEQDNSIQWIIQHLCVRKLTRRRGFARQLIQRLQQLAEEQAIKKQPSQNIQLIAEATDDLASLWLQLEFSQDGCQWCWTAHHSSTHSASSDHQG